jgi:hypothetical protein
MKKIKKVDVKVKEIMSRNMKLDFVPEYMSNLRYMVQWTIGELRNSVYGDYDAMDTLEEIIKSAKLV